MSYLCSHRSFRNRPILILLQAHISMSFFEPAYHDPPDQNTLTESIERMMKRLKFDEAGGASILSHSNGTVGPLSPSSLDEVISQVVQPS